jgi:ribonuclease VapC
LIFIDASALTSMMAGESDADALSDRVADDPIRLCSAISLWETTAGLCRSYGFTASTAKALVNDFVASHGIRLAEIGQREYELAAEAYADFGKGKHPASLNMGDCFAYACAKSNGAALLFKGDDFSKTDVRIPGPPLKPAER